MPCSSSALISVASVKRGGGSVKCWVGRDVVDVGDAALGQVRQPGAGLVLVVGRRVVAALRVDDGEAVEQHLRRRGAQLVAAVGQLDRRGLELLGRHLGRQGALPDQPVQARLVRLEEAAIASGIAPEARRADRLVRLLGALRLRLVDAALGHRVRLAVALADDLARLAHRHAGDRRRVGSHVGDEPDVALGRLDALVQALGHRHRPLRAEAEPPAGLLLERRGRERRRRRPLLGPGAELRDDRVQLADRRGVRVRTSPRRGCRAPRRRCGRARPANVSPAAVARIAWIVQYSRAVKAWISRSRSTTRRTATDWTRPADRPRWTFLPRSGLSV